MLVAMHVACVVLVLFSATASGFTRFPVPNDFKPVVVEDQYLFTPGSPGEVDIYRIPITTTCPDGTTLAFAEGRKYSGGDYGSKFLALRRSKDGGSTWSVTDFVLDDDPTVDGLNLGGVVIDHLNNSVILIYVHSHKEPVIYMTKSMDWGVTWSDPVALGDRNPKLKGYSWTAGPGYGIQKKYGNNIGRLLVCGHTMSSLTRSAKCLYSDDYGYSWSIGGGVYGMPYNMSKNAGDLVPGESQIVEMDDGSLVMMSRNTYAFHCRCRIFSKSFDSGMTFPLTEVETVEQLPDPSVCGSILRHNGIMFFSGVNSTTSRTNATLWWSFDGGATWPGVLPIYLNNSAYSCLTALDENHLGLIYEKGNDGHIAFARIRLNP
ncbi:sialidase-1-like [Ptychodera flava]|uniref:sialidase-1-like n=1 Tax=Ptychodera flava TaxID=63121 RepID=UPI00396AAD09